MYEYWYLIFAFVFVFLFAYVKIRYPFWNVQPAFHVYDFWRYWTYTPFHIQHGIPIRTKFFDNKRVKTLAYSDTTPEERAQCIDLMQCHYITSESVLTSFNMGALDAAMTGSSHPSYISFYNDEAYDIVPSTNEISIVDIIKKPIPIGCMISRPLQIFIWDNRKHVHKHFVYYWDFICMHRDKKDKMLSRNLIQTHEYNQRIQNTDISASFFKKEELLCEGIVPVVNYTNSVFYLRNVKIPKLPPHFSVVRVYKENMDILSDFMYGITHQKRLDKNAQDNSSLFSLCVLPEMGNLHSLILSNDLYVYSLKRNDNIYAIYFMKDAKVIYEDMDDGNLLECVATISNSNAEGLFFAGFLTALRRVLELEKKYTMILFSNLGHNSRILEKWKWKYSPVFENKAAYYAYNIVIPGVPISPEKCFILG